MKKIQPLRFAVSFLIFSSMVFSPPPLFFKPSFSTLAPASSSHSRDWLEDVSLIVSDVTGTLIEKETPPTDSKLKDVLDELLDLGVIFAPLSGLGRGTIQKRFLDYLTGIRHPDRIVLSVQNGGNISNFGTNEIISEKLFPSEIASLLREKIKSYLAQRQSEGRLAGVAWEFMPPEPKALKSILYISFNQPPNKKWLLDLADDIDRKLQEDPQIASFITSHAFVPFVFSVTGSHIVVSVKNKVEVLRDIVSFAKERTPQLGRTVLVLGDSGGDQGQDGKMLLLKEIEGYRLAPVYVGGEDTAWAQANHIATVPGKTGPEELP